MTTIDTRDWAVLGVMTNTVICADRETAVEVADGKPHLTAVYREPGGEWAPYTNSEKPTIRYVFLVGDEMLTGDLTDYAKHWTHAQRVGDRISPDVRTWNGASFRVTVEHRPADDADATHYVLAVGTERVRVAVHNHP